MKKKPLKKKLLKKKPLKKKIIKKKLVKKPGEKKQVKSLRKVTVGEDEFCPTCMEWRPYDELTGKCTVCGHIIKKPKESRKITEEYDLKDFTIEHDEQQDTGEF
jgi:hypothetical protein